MNKMNLKRTIRKIVLEEIRKSKRNISETYYRLYDTQTGRYMATGYNATSEEDLIDQFKSYASVDFEPEDEEYFEKATTNEILSAIESYGFDIEKSETPFSEDENEY